MPIVTPYHPESDAATITIDGIVYHIPRVDTSGRLIFVGIGSGGAVEVIQDTPADLKTAVHGLSGSTQYQLAVNALGQLVVVGIGSGGAVEVIQDTPADLKAAVHGLDGSTQRQIVVDTSGRLVATDVRERSPTTITRSYSVASVAPHGATSRWTYTVPAGKLALVSALLTHVARDGATSTPGIAQGYIQLVASGGSGVYVLLGSIISGTLGVQDHMALGQSLWLRAGDNMQGVTSDGSTGGTMFYILSMAAIEFNV